MVRRDGDQRILEDNGSSVTIDQNPREFTIAAAGMEKIAELRRHPAFADLDECDFHELVVPQFEARSGKHLCGGLPVLRWLGEYVPAAVESPTQSGCTDWLRERIGKEYHWLTDELLAEAKIKGYSFDQYRRAKDALRAEGITSRPSGGPGSPWIIGVGNPRELPRGELMQVGDDDPSLGSGKQSAKTANTANTAKTGGGDLGNLDSLDDWIPEILDRI